MDQSLLVTQPLRLTLPEIMINLIMAVVLGLAVSLLYQRTHRGVSYSQSFVSSLVLLTVITSVVIMVIGNSLTRAFGLLGAFALVRFRTAVKDARDISFLFLSLALGLATGSGAHQIAVLGIVIIGALVSVLSRMKFGAMSAYEHVLNFTVSSKQKNGEPYREVFEKYLRDSLLLNVRSQDSGKALELSFNIKLKSDQLLPAFTKDLSGIKSVSRVELISTAGDMEY